MSCNSLILEATKLLNIFILGRLYIPYVLASLFLTFLYRGPFLLLPYFLAPLAPILPILSEAVCSFPEVLLVFFKEEEKELANTTNLRGKSPSWMTTDHPPI